MDGEIPDRIPFRHKPVMPDECIEGLNIKSDGVYVDCTLGGGGHASLILGKLSKNGMLIGLDRDRAALDAAGVKLSEYISGDLPARLVLKHTNFDMVGMICEEMNIKSVNGILMDLGVSSGQLDDAERGFSYSNDAALDMRMDQSTSLTAKEIVNKWSRKDLENIIRSYGEERWASRIAQFICDSRQKEEIATTAFLAELIRNAIPASARRKGPHPAKRTFQAIRIAVNDELGSLERALAQCINLLAPDGRLCVITFHSLEDRMVKKAFEKALNPCTCPKYLPVCVCGKGKPLIENITRKPMIPSQEETYSNPRSRSAKLRIARKLT